MDIQRLWHSIQTGELRITDHADEEMATDKLSLEEVLMSVLNGEIIEDYPSDQPLPSCLVLGQTSKNDPVHSVWAYNEETGRAVLVTVYRPDPDRWIEFRARKT